MEHSSRGWKTNNITQYQENHGGGGLKVYTAGRPQPPHLQLAPALNLWSKQMDMKSSCEELPGMNNITLTCPLEQNKLTACMCRHEPGGAVFEIGVCECVSRVCGKMSDPRRPITKPLQPTHTFTQIAPKLRKRCLSTSVPQTDAVFHVLSYTCLFWQRHKDAHSQELCSHEKPDVRTVSNNLAML